jgi:hypothetical protein
MIERIAIDSARWIIRESSADRAQNRNGGPPVTPNVVCKAVAALAVGARVAAAAAEVFRTAALGPTFGARTGPTLGAGPTPAPGTSAGTRLGAGPGANSEAGRKAGAGATPGPPAAAREAAADLLHCL